MLLGCKLAIVTDSPMITKEKDTCIFHTYLKEFSRNQLVHQVRHPFDYHNFGCEETICFLSIWPLKFNNPTIVLLCIYFKNADTRVYLKIIIIEKQLNM